MTKNILIFLTKKYKKLNFLQGVIFTICLTSLLSIAATNLPGFYIFSPGTPISSSEINANFEKIAGSVVVKASMTTSFSAVNADFITPTDCVGCTNKIYRKKIILDTVTINDTNLKTSIDNDLNSASNGNSFSYYQVAATGWYEIRFIADLTFSSLNALCSAPACSHNIGGGIGLFVVNDLASTSYNFYSNIGSYFYTGKSESDSNSDSVLDPSFNTYTASPPEIKRVYLKLGQILLIKLEASFYQTNVTSDYTVSVPANSIQLEIIKL